MKNDNIHPCGSRVLIIFRYNIVNIFQSQKHSNYCLDQMIIQSANLIGPLAWIRPISVIYCVSECIHIYGINISLVHIDRSK